MTSKKGFIAAASWYEEDSSRLFNLAFKNKRTRKGTRTEDNYSHNLFSILDRLEKRFFTLEHPQPPEVEADDRYFDPSPYFREFGLDLYCSTCFEMMPEEVFGLFVHFSEEHTQNLVKKAGNLDGLVPKKVGKYFRKELARGKKRDNPKRVFEKDVATKIWRTFLDMVTKLERTPIDVYSPYESDLTTNCELSRACHHCLETVPVGSVLIVTRKSTSCLRCWSSGWHFDSAVTLGVVTKEIVVKQCDVRSRYCEGGEEVVAGSEFPMVFFPFNNSTNKKQRGFECHYNEQALNGALRISPCSNKIGGAGHNFYAQKSVVVAVVGEFVEGKSELMRILRGRRVPKRRSCGIDLFRPIEKRRRELLLLDEDLGAENVDLKILYFNARDCDSWIPKRVRKALQEHELEELKRAKEKFVTYCHIPLAMSLSDVVVWVSHDEKLSEGHLKRLVEDNGKVKRDESNKPVLVFVQKTKTKKEPKVDSMDVDLVQSFADIHTLAYPGDLDDDDSSERTEKEIMAFFKTKIIGPLLIQAQKGDSTIYPPINFDNLCWFERFECAVHMFHVRDLTRNNVKINLVDAANLIIDFIVLDSEADGGTEKEVRVPIPSAVAKMFGGAVEDFVSIVESDKGDSVRVGKWTEGSLDVTFDALPYHKSALISMLQEVCGVGDGFAGISKTDADNVINFSVDCRFLNMLHKCAARFPQSVLESLYASEFVPVLQTEKKFVPAKVEISEEFGGDSATVFNKGNLVIRGGVICKAGEVRLPGEDSNKSFPDAIFESNRKKMGATYVSYVGIQFGFDSEDDSHSHVSMWPKRVKRKTPYVRLKVELEKTNIISYLRFFFILDGLVGNTKRQLKLPGYFVNFGKIDILALLCELLQQRQLDWGQNPVQGMELKFDGFIWRIRNPLTCSKDEIFVSQWIDGGTLNFEEFFSLSNLHGRLIVDVKRKDLASEHCWKCLENVEGEELRVCKKCFHGIHTKCQKEKCVVCSNEVNLEDGEPKMKPPPEESSEDSIKEDQE